VQSKDRFRIPEGRGIKPLYAALLEDILIGDVVLGAVGTAGAFGLFGEGCLGAGAGAGGARPPAQPVPIKPPAPPIPKPTPPLPLPKAA
jgi:hypothetical protein